MKTGQQSKHMTQLWEALGKPANVQNSELIRQAAVRINRLAKELGDALDTKARDNPIRDCYHQICARAVANKVDGLDAASEEAQACANLIEERLKGKWWLEIDALKMVKKEEA